MSHMETGREYTLTWTDASDSTVPSRLVFGAFTLHHRLEEGDHVLAPYQSHIFVPGTVAGKWNKSGKLKIEFTDGSCRYVTLRLYFC